jgi:hypothetical protein
VEVMLLSIPRQWYLYWMTPWIRKVERGTIELNGTN